MNHSFDYPTRQCRNLLVPSRRRRQMMAESLDKRWRELRMNWTIESDSAKLARLVAEEKRKPKKEVMRNTNPI